MTLLGANPETIDKAEDRQMFKDTMEKIGQPCIPSKVVTTVEDAEAFALEIDDQFRLVVEYPDGRRAALSAGEVSVRGMYGYV